MGLWSALTDNQIYNFEQAFGAKDMTSSAMQRAIESWFAMYFDTAEAPEDEDGCQRLPVVVVNKLYKAVFGEYEAAISGSDFLARCMENLDSVRKRAMQMALIGGECLIKPVFARGAFQFVVVRRDCMVPLARDGAGRLTSVGTVETTKQGKWRYSLLERRTVDAEGYLTIECKLYRSGTAGALGTQVPLPSLACYSDLKERVTLPHPIWNLGMAALRTPIENTVDGSSDAVSVYAAAVKLIRNINRNEKQIDQEFENGRSRLIASADMVTKDSMGRKKLADDFYIGVDDDPESVGVTIFSPALREQSYLARKQEYLRNIENLIGLKRGLLSEVEAAERTATEVTSSMGDYSLTIQDFQQMWEDMLKELLPTCLTLGQMYGLCKGEGFNPEKDLSIDWGNGILYDKDKTWAEIMQMVAAGMLKPEIALAWKYDEPWQTPEDLAKVRRMYLPELEGLVGGEV
jgi:A118 family predicted phage portal protein